MLIRSKLKKSSMYHKKRYNYPFSTRISNLTPTTRSPRTIHNVNYHQLLTCMFKYVNYRICFEQIISGIFWCEREVWEWTVTVGHQNHMISWPRTDNLKKCKPRVTFFSESRKFEVWTWYSGITQTKYSKVLQTSHISLNKMTQSMKIGNWS